jgi:glycosyltransferase involved in cell wall biosynthesis
VQLESSTGIEMMDHRIRFVVFRYAHHSPHSGYSRFAEYGMKHFNGEVCSVRKPLSRTMIRERMLWRIARGTPGYDRASMAAELNVAGHILKESSCIYHFLYGEKTYHYSGLLNNVRKNRLVASFHFPPAGIRKAVQIDWHLRQLSAVVCLGRNQQAFFSEFLDPKRIFFIPLGVDTEFYTPSDFEERDNNLCLFVGENYRDFPTFRGVIELVAYRRPETRFVAVTQSQNWEYIGSHPNLTVRSGISESDFLQLYRSASLLVMPLHDAVANNALLEGLACGVPTIVTDVGAIRDYVNGDCAILTRPSDSLGMAEAVLDLLGDCSHRQEMSKRARNQALNFAWPKVVEQLGAVYSAIA